MSSSRLPGKILMDIAGQTMLARVFSRVSRSKLVDEVTIATTTDSSDDPVVEFCNSNDLSFQRGSLYDVLDRFYQALRYKRPEFVVRITADCPVIDPNLIDDAVDTILREDYDLVCNRLPAPYHRTYPIGLDVEVCKFEALEIAWKESKLAHFREHVIPYIYEGVQLVKARAGLEQGTSVHGFRIALLHNNIDYGNYRWTVDTPEDLEFVRRIYEHFTGRDDFSWMEVLELVLARPELMEINAGIRHNTLNNTDARTPQS